ncbi:nickel pincer cofactor biosynthesis protein LarB [Mucisphaera sp.]|uniref:nickel pincer cofactor biosynthesis protein LarB n=1 Tax=Mucisphaera sp. TaxID=2913024 RepID=UPI003D0CECB4
MHEATAVDEILRRLAGGELTQAEAKQALLDLQARPLGFATVDLDRDRRCGAAEVIFGQGKTAEHLVAIARTLRDSGACVLATRCNKEQISLVRSAFEATESLRIDELARTVTIGDPPTVDARSAVTIVTGGTSDLPVAMEAKVTCEALGHPTHLIADVGVAGLHRLLGRVEEIRRADVVIAVAGMEAALPSVLGGLLDAPIIAVPTSVGYGAHFQGLASLLSSLNSCASGVATVNIDNGFGAAYIACRINALASGAGVTQQADEA